MKKRITIILAMAMAIAVLTAGVAQAQAPPDVKPPADITQVASPDPATVGQPLTFTTTVTNIQPYEVSGVHITDYIPAGTEFVSATPSQGSCTGMVPSTSPIAELNGSPGVVECDLGTLPSGATATIDVVVIPTVAGTATNVATYPKAQQGDWAEVTVNEAQPPLSNYAY